MCPVRQFGTFAIIDLITFCRDSSGVGALAYISAFLLALVYELSKERIERYKTVSLHPFGAPGRLRSIGATFLLAVPGFLLNHVNFIGQFLGVK